MVHEVGLALWQNCTLDLPLHPHTVALLFGHPEQECLGVAKKRAGIRTRTSLADMDSELYKHKAL